MLHAAAVVEDATSGQQYLMIDQAKLEGTRRGTFIGPPPVTGVVLLSLGRTCGLPGQGAYVAANSWLTLCPLAAAQGLPATFTAPAEIGRATAPVEGTGAARPPRVPEPSRRCFATAAPGYAPIMGTPWLTRPLRT